MKIVTNTPERTLILQSLPWEDQVDEAIPSVSDLEKAIHDAEMLVDESLFELDEYIDVAS